MNVNRKLFVDFCKFATAHVATGDVDPMYPVLAAAYAAEGLDRETALWRTLLYITWYHIGSADAAWTLLPSPLKAIPTSVRVPRVTGIERRGFRGNTKCYDMLDALLSIVFRKYGSLDAWVSSGEERGWRGVRDSIEAVPYCGPWASYKWADLMKHVHGYNIVADDIGVGGGSATAGPIPGMVRLTGETWQRCAQDTALQNELLGLCRSSGVMFSGLEQMETSLCDFNSLCKGHYYVGHDIDMQQVQLQGCRSSLLAARPKVFPHNVLGELNGWVGLRPNLSVCYRDKGLVWPGGGI